MHIPNHRASTMGCLKHLSGSTLQILSYSNSIFISCFRGFRILPEESMTRMFHVLAQSLQSISISVPTTMKCYSFIYAKQKSTVIQSIVI
jgi:hypothetical protein